MPFGRYFVYLYIFGQKMDGGFGESPCGEEGWGGYNIGLCKSSALYCQFKMSKALNVSLKSDGFYLLIEMTLKTQRRHFMTHLVIL